jgi:hypothetical protein
MLPRREADLDAADAFLPLLLGTVSALRRFDGVLSRVPAAPPGAPAPVPASPEDRATVHLILGVISLRDRLEAHLDRLPPPAAAARAAIPAGSNHRLLR